MTHAFTIFAVSIDAFIAGFAYSVNSKLDNLSVFYAGLYTFVFSILALLLNYYCIRNVPHISIIGGVIFIVLGLKNYLEFFQNGKALFVSKSKTNPTLLGVGVSIDASVACLSVELSNFNFILPYAFFMYVGHYLFLLLGARSAGGIKTTKYIAILSGFSLITLGIMRLI